jgi:Domain of unknown function (DUF6046)
MAIFSLSLGDLFEQTFGYKTQAFNPDFDAVQGYTYPNRTEQGAQGTPLYATDALGREYFMPVVFLIPQSESGTVTAKYSLPYPVVSVTARKTVISTPLTERRGTVKELINSLDYEITIRGFIIGAGNEFPEQEVAQLRNLYEQNTALSVQCVLTDLFLLRPDRKGSDQVVITELRFPAVSGVKNVRPYELRLVSDEPFNLEDISE